MGKNESYNHADVIGTNEMDRASEDHLATATYLGLDWITWITWITWIKLDPIGSLPLNFGLHFINKIIDEEKVANPLISQCSVNGRSSFSSVAVPSRLRFRVCRSPRLRVVVLGVCSTCSNNNDDG